MQHRIYPCIFGAKILGAEYYVKQGPYNGTSAHVTWHIRDLSAYVTRWWFQFRSLYLHLT